MLILLKKYAFTNCFKVLHFSTFSNIFIFSRVKWIQKLGGLFVKYIKFNNLTNFSTVYAPHFVHFGQNNRDTRIRINWIYASTFGLKSGNPEMCGSNFIRWTKIVLSKTLVGEQMTGDDKSANDEPANEDGTNIYRGFQYSTKSHRVCRWNVNRD